MDHPKMPTTTDPSILHGEPHFHGTRIPVTVVLDNLKDGRTPDEILAQYPTLTTEHIRAARTYAAETGSGSEESLRDFHQLLEKARQAAAETGLTRGDVEDALASVRSVTDHLGSPEECAAYLQAAIEEGDPELIVAALRDVFDVTGICEQHGVERMWVFGSVLDRGRRVRQTTSTCSSGSNRWTRTSGWMPIPASWKVCENSFLSPPTSSWRMRSGIPTGRPTSTPFGPCLR